MQLTKQLQQEEDKVLRAQAAVEKRAEELDKQAEALTQEKQKMSAVGIADNDVLDLNVGGVSLSVKRATLTQVKGSHLASIFSGRWEGCLDHDANGRIFLDFDPYSFQQILMTLRCRPFDLAKNVAPPEAVMTPDKLHAYKCLVDYLGLEGVCGAADESSNLASDTCQLTHVSDNAIVTQGVTKGQWVTCVRPIKMEHAFANAGPEMSTEQVYYIKLENSQW
ncbi:hypothetical protein WJX79_006959 [Trebouxia sp. C0005]